MGVRTTDQCHAAFCMHLNPFYNTRLLDYLYNRLILKYLALLNLCF